MPCSAAWPRSHGSSTASRSTPTTSAPRVARASEMMPSPQPRSSTFRPAISMPSLPTNSKTEDAASSKCSLHQFGCTGEPARGGERMAAEGPRCGHGCQSTSGAAPPSVNRIDAAAANARCAAPCSLAVDAHYVAQMAPEPNERDVAPTAGLDYAERLATIQNVWWKRALHVQAPYQANVRHFGLGRAIDVGCGIGRNLKTLAPGSVGVDHNPYAIDVARRTGVAAYTDVEFFADPNLAARQLRRHARRARDRAPDTSRRSDDPRTYLPLVRPGGRVAFITPQERGFASDATHITFTGFAELRRWPTTSGWRRCGRRRSRSHASPARRSSTTSSCSWRDVHPLLPEPGATPRGRALARRCSRCVPLVRMHGIIATVGSGTQLQPITRGDSTVACRPVAQHRSRLRAR